MDRSACRPRTYRRGRVAASDRRSWRETGSWCDRGSQERPLNHAFIAHFLSKFGQIRHRVPYGTGVRGPTFEFLISRA